LDPDSRHSLRDWRLAGSTPAAPLQLFSREDAGFSAVHSLEEQVDDRAASGPFWLQDTKVVSMLAKALRYGGARPHGEPPAPPDWDALLAR
jgi:hypothetical protein